MLFDLSKRGLMNPIDSVRFTLYLTFGLSRQRRTMRVMQFCYYYAMRVNFFQIRMELQANTTSIQVLVSRKVNRPRATKRIVGNSPSVAVIKDRTVPYGTIGIYCS